MNNLQHFLKIKDVTTTIHITPNLTCTALVLKPLNILYFNKGNVDNLNLLETNDRKRTIFGLNPRYIVGSALSAKEREKETPLRAI